VGRLFRSLNGKGKKGTKAKKDSEDIRISALPANRK